MTTLGELTASLAHEPNQPISGAISNADSCLLRLNALGQVVRTELALDFPQIVGDRVWTAHQFHLSLPAAVP